MSKHARDGEIEARHLLAVGVAVADVAEITGIDRAKVKAMSICSAGPYSHGEAAEVLGLSERSIYRAVNGEIARQDIAEIAEERLREYGERKARFLLFTGKTPRLAAIRGRMPEEKAELLLRKLVKAGVGPETPGPYTVDQASLVLGLADRQVRAYCQHGRLGVRFGKTYLISRRALIEFGAKDRRPGWPTGMKQAS